MSGPSVHLPSLAIGATLGVCACYLYQRYHTAASDPSPPLPGGRVVRNASELIGDTPLIRLASLSAASGCEIYGKAEYLSVFGSSKDRVALSLVRAAASCGSLRPGGVLVEGSSGSTGISLALLARALGYSAAVHMPDDVAPEKASLLRALGAAVELLRPAAIVSPAHYVNAARRAAEAACAAGGPGAALFCDQFESPANAAAHAAGTGAEIWAQTRGRVAAFVCGAGTGGTLAGVAAALKAENPGVRCFLVDPPGSSLLNRVRHGVAFAPQQAERSQRRHRRDTLIEGVGCDRITANFAAALPLLEGAVACSDEEAAAMARQLLREEGIFVGASSALNCVGALKVAAGMPRGSTIVTVLCDAGARHVSTLFNDEWLRKEGVTLPQEKGSGRGEG